MGKRRRKLVRRIRPVTSDEFVTAETQHINSAVNSLESSLDSTKYNSHEESTKSMIKSLESLETTQSPVEFTESSSASESMESNDTVTINYTENPEQAKAEELTTISLVSSDALQEKTINEDKKIPETTESFSLEIDTTVTDSPPTTTILPTTTMPTTTTRETTTKKTWDVTKGYADWFVKKPQQYYQTGLEAADDTDRENANNDKNGTEGSDNYPKNHRPEWSEVHYKSDREAHGYARSEVLPPPAQVPGIVTKSVGDTSVKTLSDYVQAIFDTMKNADEEGGLVDNGSSPPEIKVETNTNSLHLDNDDQEKEMTTKSEPIEENTKKVAKSLSIPTTSTTSRPSEDLTTLKLLQTDFKSSITNSGIPTVPNTVITNQTSDISNKKSPQTKLGEILRTSTSTKVSHMTEICYRGRCVMTKPRKDSEKR